MRYDEENKLDPFISSPMRSDPVVLQDRQAQPETPMEEVKPVGEEQCREWNKILDKYKSAKAATDRRVVSSQNWWRMRNTEEARRETELGKDGGFTSRSAWLHNVISNKHADAMEAFPEANIRAREPSDQQEAKMLSDIVPCILENIEFEDTYSDVQWSKGLCGTGVYKIFWDAGTLNGLGDISIKEVSLLNLFWQPGCNDIQQSKYLFQLEDVDIDELEEQYPEQLKGRNLGSVMGRTRFQTDDRQDTDGKCTVREVYYKKTVGGRKVLHYCRYVDDIVLYATENDGGDIAQSGLYDHGQYPFVFDVLFPLAASPVGYGYIDIGRNPQTKIDLIDTAAVKNVIVNATPRYFSRDGGNIDEHELLDLSKPIIHVEGNVDEASLRQVNTAYLPGACINMLERSVNELRETSGNTETSTGSGGGGVTAASAIAALQEAAGKGSRDATRGSYRAFRLVVLLVIELVRQFYDLPRQFRITGAQGQDSFVTFDNSGIRGQQQTDVFGNDMGIRKPVFDCKVSAQKANIYTKVSQNELALQLYQLGFFNPQMGDQALTCLEVMDFDGKDDLIQKLSQNSQLQQKLMYYIQQTAQMAQMVGDPMAAQQAMMDMQQMGMAPPMPAMAGRPQMAQTDAIAGIGAVEPTRVQNARARAGQASQPMEEGTVQ